MAEVVLHPAPQSFPPGTTVKVIERPLPERPGGPLSGQPSGTVLSEPTVASNGSLTVTGLTEGSRYVAYVQLAGIDRYLFFEVVKAAAGGEGPTAEATRKSYTATGITGAATSSRWAGAVASGHPTSGTFATGDWTIDLTGTLWVCTAGGTPGTWSSPSGAGGALLKANNLSDVASAATSRTNLGLGTAATEPATAFAKTANNLSDLASAETARTNLGLGTAAQEAATAFLKAANNLSDVVTPATARTNLGLGSAAVEPATAFAKTANNLSDLANAATARTNLGLGTSATHAEGDFAKTANNLSDLASASTARTNLGLGTSATHAEGDFAKTANNLSDLASASTARTNLGLGTAAVEAATAFAKTANNLSDLAAAATARENLRVPVLAACKAVATTNIASLEGTTTIDGIALEAGDQVLLTGQTESKNNGPWVIAAGAWTRPEDFSTGFELKSARLVLVLKGTVNALTTWALTTTGAIVIGTTAHEWTRLAGPEVQWKAVEALNAKLEASTVRAAVLNGVIYLTGSVTVHEEVTAKSIVFTLPVGCRPEKEVTRLIVGAGASEQRAFNVKTNGEVETVSALKTTVSPIGFSWVLALK